MSKVTTYVVGAAIVYGNRCLIGQRRSGGSFGNLWEFPGGKPEAAESATEALRRELQEELGLAATIGEHLTRSRLEQESRALVLDVYLAYPDDPSAPILRLDHRALAFAHPDEFAAYDWAPLDIPALPLVKERLSAASPCELPRIVEET